MGVLPQHLLSFKVSPAGNTKPVLVKSSNISDRPNTQELLIIGFDTEYQSVDGSTDNQVISYQFSAEIIEPRDYAEVIEWSGIILPNSLEVSDRYSITDFLSVVVSEGISAHPNIKIPKHVYLFAHYTNADIPAFAEFKDDTSRKNLRLENIRKSFVNVHRNVRFYVPETGTDQLIEFNLLIRDTTHIAAGGKSLDAIGQLIGAPKVVLADNLIDELEIKKRMLELYERDWDLFYKYAMQDAVITRRYAIRILRQYQDLTGKFKFPLTLTAIGVDLLLKNWREASNKSSIRFFTRKHIWNDLYLSGKEELSENIWSEKKQRYVTKRHTQFFKKLWWKKDFFIDGYHGGRNEQFWFGPMPEGKWYDYDLTSAYPSVMSLIGYPLWDEIRALKDTKELLSLKHVDLCVANVDFEFPEDVRFPCLPIRTEGGLIFPRKGNTTAHISEILVAKALGAEINMVEGAIVPTIRFNGGGTEVRPFLSFSIETKRNRNQFAKGTLENAFWKEMANSLYGKTAQGLDKRRVYNLQSEESTDLEPSKISNPFYASMICGFCRATLAEIMNRLPQHVMICSVTTDGFATNATPAEMDQVTSTMVKGFPWEDDECDFEQYPPNSCVGYYREAAKVLKGIYPQFPAHLPIYEVKHISRQILGWRTRGQATLKAGTDEDLADVGLKDEDEKLILAATGLDFPRYYSKSDRNIETLSTFFNRTPNLSIPKKRLRGIREIYEGGLDATEKETTLAVSMEFDWKRRPTKAIDVEVPEHGTQHLQFQTQPWDDIVQYNTMRSNWRLYTQPDRKCLKSVEDLMAFDNFNSSHRSLLKSGAGKYLRREGGALKRLRQQISIAQYLRRAGTHKLKPHAYGIKSIFPTKKLTAVELANCLIAAGVPCKKFDVDNARKKVRDDEKKAAKEAESRLARDSRKTGFIPKQIPRNEETLAVLHNLKKNLFPLLDIDLLLSEDVEDFYVGEK
jgi:hypothetical protein